MNRQRSRGRLVRKWALLVGLLALAGLGCSPGSLGWLLRDSMTKPEHPLPPKEGKKEVTVLVIATQMPSVGMNNANFASAAQSLGSLIGKRLAEDTKADKTPIRIVDPAKFERLKATMPDWRTTNPAAFGQKLGADYVLDVNLCSISTYQPEYGPDLLCGKATVEVTAYDTAKPEAPMQQYPYTSMQPQKSIEGTNVAHYSRFVLERLAQEIAWKHIPHDSQERMPKMN